MEWKRLEKASVFTQFQVDLYKVFPFLKESLKREKEGGIFKFFFPWQMMKLALCIEKKKRPSLGKNYTATKTRTFRYRATLHNDSDPVPVTSRHSPPPFQKTNRVEM